MIIKGDLILMLSLIQSLGNLKEVYGKLNARGCYSLTSLGNLERVDGTLTLSGCKNLKNLGRLKKFNPRYSIKLLESGITREYIKKQKPELIHVCDFNS